MSNGPEITPLASPPVSTPWVPLWPLAPAQAGELAQAVNLADIAITATTAPTANTIVTAPAVTLDGNTEILIEVQIPILATAAAGSAITVELWDGSTGIGPLSQPFVSQGQTQFPFFQRKRLKPAAGAHTYIAKAFASAASNAYGAGFGGHSIRIALASPLLTAPPGAVVPVQYGTTLPASPLDGQEAILVDSLTSPSYTWRFRYNAGSGSPYKWEFIGGSEFYAPTGSGEISTINTWVDLPTPSNLVVPRAGVYSVLIGGSVQGPAGQAFLGPAIGASTPAAYASGRVDTAAAWDAVASLGQNMVLSAGDQVRLRGFVGVTLTFGQCWMRVIPHRVS